MRAPGYVIPPVPSAPPASSADARKRMKANRSRDTAPEMALRRELHRRGYRFRVDRAPVSSLRCRADLVFSRVQVAVFVDGCFWHGCPEHMSWPKANRDWWKTKISATVARDRRNDAVLRAAGWTVLRVWEHHSPQLAAELVIDTIGEIEAEGSPKN
jgi:DNA mismatch endonuclease, patch repair protein